MSFQPFNLQKIFGSHDGEQDSNSLKTVIANECLISTISAPAPHQILPGPRALNCYLSHEHQTKYFTKKRNTLMPRNLLLNVPHIASAEVPIGEGYSNYFKASVIPMPIRDAVAISRNNPATNWHAGCWGCVDIKTTHFAHEMGAWGNILYVQKSSRTTGSLSMPGHVDAAQVRIYFYSVKSSTFGQ